MSEAYGILSDHNNPFKEWTLIHMKYCDGTGHQGYRKDPVLYKGSKLWFRGHNNTIGQLNSIDNLFNIFTQAKEIIVTGQSAGGLATFLWSNYIVNKASTSTKIRAVSDSGIFLDQVNYLSKMHNYRSHIINFM